MFVILRHLVAAAGLLLLSTPLIAQAPEAPSPAMLEDAAHYAADQGLELDEAIRRLQLQRAAGALAAELRVAEVGSFAGLWIEHDPVWRVNVRYRGPLGVERIESYVAGGPLEGLVDVHPAKVSLERLEQRQATVHHLARQLGFKIDSQIDVVENRIDAFSLRPEAFQNALGAAGLRLPDRVQVIPATQLAQFDVLRGGDHGSTCTGGYTVRAFSGELGISTAAHCGNSQSFQGTSLPFRSEDQEGNQDIQWHSACDLLDVSNEFNSGIGDRACTGTQHRDQQAIGSFVCKYGKTTGRTCGYIQTKSYSLSYVTNSASTFVRVDGQNLRAGGDSGGPWFVEHLAYGTHSGAPGDDPNDAIYMPINYISSLGVSVLTSDPGVCNLRPNASFTYTVSGNWVDFDASGSSDPDGTITSYHWDFGDGSTTTTTSPFVSHFYSTVSSYSVRLTVTDNEGATDIQFGFVSMCGNQRLCKL